MAYDLGTAEGTIEIDYNGARSVKRAEDDIKELQKASKDTDGQLKKLGATLGKVFGGGLKLGALAGALTQAGAAAGSLLIQVLGIVPALASILSLSAALPALWTSMLATTLILKAAFLGVADAVKAAFGDDPAKFEEALKKLSPEARATAIELRKMVPLFKELQQGIQNAFFGNGFHELFPQVAVAVRRLQPMLNLIASEFGAIAYEVAKFGTSVGSINFVDQALIGLQHSLENISPAIKPVLNGLRDVGFVGLPLMDRLSLAVGKVGERFGYWLQDISADGRLEAWIEQGIATLKTLGGIVSNLGDIFGNLFRIAESTGGGLLNTIEEVTGAFADFLDSTEGQKVISDLFSSILEVARQLTPAITTLVGALAGALGPAIRTIAEGVGPELLKVVEALAPAFGPLAQGVADVLAAVAPLLPPLAKLVSLIATSLGNGLSILAAELGPVISLLGGAFLEAFQKLTPVIEKMIQVAAPLAAEFGIELAAALAPLVPVIVELAQAFVDALLPVLPELMAAAQQLLPAIVALAASLGGSLATSLRAIIPILPTLVAGFTALVTTSATLISFFLRVATSANNMTQKITAAIGLLIYWVKQIPTVIGAAIGAAIGFLVKFAPRAASAIAALPGAVVRVVSAAMNAVRNAVAAGVNAAVSTAATLPRRAASAITALISLLSGVARNAWNSLRAAFNSGVNSAVAVARTIAGRVRSAVGNLGGVLRSAGAALIQGLINGISSGIGRVMGMVSSLAARVRSAFSSALAIFSPSRVFFDFGVNIDEGLINGIKAKLKDVFKAGTLIAKAVIQPTMATPNGAMGMFGPAFTKPAPSSSAAEAGAERPQFFGPYQLELDGAVVSEFVVDTITGNPTVVAKASTEGARTQSFVGSGR